MADKLPCLGKARSGALLADNIFQALALTYKKGLALLRGLSYKEVELADKPGPVVDSYSSRPAIAHRLKQPTRFLREQRIYYLK